MGIIKNIIKNTSSVIFGNFVENFLNLLITIYLARYFGQKGFGTISFLAAFLYFVAVAGNLWIRPVLIREMSREGRDAGVIAGNGLVIKLIVSLVGIIIFWASILFIRPAPDVIALALFTTVMMLFTSISSSYAMVFQVKLKMGFFVVFTLLNKLLVIGALYLITTFKGGLFHYYLYTVLIFVFTFPFLKLSSDKIIKPQFDFDPGLWRAVFKDSWPLGLSAFFVFLYSRFDQLMLYAIKGEAEVGLYSAGVKLAEILSILPLACATSILPVISRYHDSDKEAFRKMYEALFKYLLIFIIPVAFFSTVYSRPIVSLFFGKGFLAVSGSFVILMWAEIFVFLGVINNTLLVASYRQNLDCVFTGISAFINIALNLALIPSLGFTGAAIASMIAYAAGPVTGYLFPSTRRFARCMFLHSLKPMAAGAVSVFICYYARLDFWLSLFVAPSFYFLMLYLINGASLKELLILEKELR